MEPLDDRDLDLLLAEWKAPGAPATLRARVLPQRQRWWRWLLTGTIRIPVPVGVLTVLVAAVWIYLATTSRPPAEVNESPGSAPVVSLADFEPVDRVEPRIVGEAK